MREGVTDVFGYPGGAILPAYDAMLDYPIRHVLVRHEQGATHMADGYARASGRVGVAIATSGPGATNMVTGIATAMMDSSPIVCITGQVGSRLIGSDAFQEIDITGITLPITKHNYLVTNAEEVARAVREAFVIAKTGRPGPVLIDITKDAQQATCEFDWEAAAPVVPEWRRVPDAGNDSLQEAAALINGAERPVIFAGHGVLISGAMAELRALAERSHIPVAMTLLGIGGFAASHPLNIGMMGMHGEAWVNLAIQEADLLIACGMRFDDRVTGNLRTYAPNARKIHIEIDPSEINKNVAADVPLVGDLRDVLDAAHARGGARRPDHLAAPHQRSQRRLRGPRHPVAARRGPPLRGARHQRSLARDAQQRHHRRHRRRTAPDVGSAGTTTTRFPARSSRPADSARWGSRCRRRSARSARGRRPRSGRSSATAASR